MVSKKPLERPAVDRLAIAVEEAAKAADVANPRFVEPARGTLDRAKARRHHILFGRRGAGKTSLLSKAAADLTIDRRPIAVVNLETFKGHSYPDVLLSVLIEALVAFKKWFKTAATNPATKTTFWKKLFGTAPKRPPLKGKEVKELVYDIEKQIEVLTKQLHSSEASHVTQTSQHAREEGSKVGVGAKVSMGSSSLDATAGVEESASYQVEQVEKFRRSKLDFLKRHIIEFRTLFSRVSEISEGDAFLFFDDLYHIRRADQPSVVDYFYRIAKGNRLWLKIGTIRNRTEWYRHSDPPVGLKLGDDAEEIDLDLTLEKYGITKKFLVSILEDIAREKGFADISELLAPTAVDRLVLASGGVARDFLALFRRSIDLARERGGGARGSRIAAEDVNQAAGDDSAKRDELKRDTLEEKEDEYMKFAGREAWSGTSLSYPSRAGR